MDNEIIMSYNTKIYNEMIIKKCIDDYKNICEVNVELKDNNFKCTFSNFKFDPIETILEFSNYLIENINMR